MNARTLARIHRVRTLQLGLAQAEEARQRDALTGEERLQARIGGLVDAVAPTAGSTGALGLAAAALYRDRLQQSADAVSLRVRTAEDRSTTAAAATRAARQDQGAVEKLLARALRDAAAAETRAAANLPDAHRKRHGPC